MEWKNTKKDKLHRKIEYKIEYKDKIQDRILDRIQDRTHDRIQRNTEVERKNTKKEVHSTFTAAFVGRKKCSEGGKMYR